MSFLRDPSILALGLGAYGMWAVRRPSIADGYDQRPVDTCFMCGDEDVRVNHVRPSALLDHQSYCDDCVALVGQP